MIVIGEKINGTRPEVADAILRRDADRIRHLARSQAAAGADYLDLNAGTGPDREPDDLVWLVETVRTAADCRLCLDSANPAALEAGIRAAPGRVLLNSLSGEQDRIDGVLPLAQRYGTELVLLALDDHGVPATPEARLAVVQRLVGLARGAGLPDDALYVDPLITTVATDPQAPAVALDTLRRVRAALPGLHLTCGLSNVSFGLPARAWVNRAFLAMAVAEGLDCAILDPCEPGLAAILRAAELVQGLDPDCRRYNEAARAGTAPAVSRALQDLTRALAAAGLVDAGGDAAPGAGAEESVAEPPAGAGDLLAELEAALVAMDKPRVDEISARLLEGGADPLAVLEASRRAMEEVGRRFEAREYFVPELILAGRMLQEIAGRAGPLLAAGAGPAPGRGRVLIGTVAGDIHDIGKDIVVTLLEVNGYEVRDLGVDVPPDRFVEAAREFRPHVVGLSGFLTLAYDPMRDTIAALRASGFGDVKVMIGGGQVDDQVRAYTGADATGRDAMEAVRLCGEWIET